MSVIYIPGLLASLFGDMIASHQLPRAGTEL